MLHVMGGVTGHSWSRGRASILSCLSILSLHEGLFLCDEKGLNTMFLK